MTTPAAQNLKAIPEPGAQIGRVVFIAFLGLAAIAWIGIAVAANSRTPGLIGFATSVFGGFFVALLIAAVGGGIALKLSEPKKAELLPPVMSADELGGEMHAILADLEGYRQHVSQQVIERSAWRVPACAGVGLCAWTLLALTGAPGGAMDFVAVMAVGGLVGYLWSVKELSQQYSKLYRERVLPRLAASFGEITWRNAVMPDLSRLKAERIFRAFGEAHATNELAGTYRGLPISIVELKLMSAEEKKKDEAVFDGLLIDIYNGRRTLLGVGWTLTALALTAVEQGPLFANGANLQTTSPTAFAVMFAAVFLGNLCFAVDGYPYVLVHLQKVSVGELKPLLVAGCDARGSTR